MKKKLKKQSGIVKKLSSTDNLKVSVAAFELMESGLGSLEGKKGFEIFQCYRDFFINLVHEPKKLELFSIDNTLYSVFDNFQLFDPAYKDNFISCATIKLKLPELYDDSIKIIDKYVRPKKRNEGLNYLYQECGGLLALLLKEYEGLSIRQALHVGSKFTKYSESTIEKSYRQRVINVREKLSSELPSPLVLIMLYWTLHARGAQPDQLVPFKKNDTRSKGKNQETIAAYWRFTEKVARHHYKNTIKFLQKNNYDIVHLAAKEFGVNFPAQEKDIIKPEAFTVFIILLASLFVEFMPEVLEKYDRIAKKIS